MDERTLRVLEYDKVLELLAGFAASNFAKDRARRLQPETRADLVRLRLRETSEATGAINRYGTMPFGGLTDVSEPLKKARAMVSLAGTEFLALAALIRCGQRLRGRGPGARGGELGAGALGRAAAGAGRHSPRGASPGDRES